VPAAADADLALRLAKGTVDVYSSAVDDLLNQVAKRLARGIDSPGWAETKLAETVRLRDHAVQVLERLQVLGPQAIEAGLTEAYLTGAAEADTDLASLDAGDASIRAQLTPATHQRAVAQLVAETVTQVTATHGQILRTTLDAYRTVIAETSAPGVLTGTQTRRQAAQRALDRFADRGVTGFMDAAGRQWELTSYTEMATRTAVGHAQVGGTLDRLVDAGRDLVIVSDHTQECKACRPWEGKVLSVSGATATGTRVEGGDGARFTVAGTVREAQSAGLQHANCRHRLAAFVPGLTQRMEHTADPEGDEARQQQRYLERGIRRWKQRSAVAMDDETRAAADRHIGAWQKRLREHVAENDLKRLRHREQIGAAI
jgi:hypothetical protein